MTFWIIAIALALVATTFVVLALLRGKIGDEPPAAYDLRVYRDQLKEVDRDLARGVIAATDADRVRIEVSRRILAADAQLQQNDDNGGQPKQVALIAAALTAVVLIAGTAWLYSTLGAPGYLDQPLKHRIATAKERHDSRPTQAEFVTDLPVQPAKEPDTEQYAQLMKKLRDTVAERPDDLQGHALLARNESSLGNMAAAATAQANVIRLKGDETTSRDYIIYADILINETQGYVSPEAEAALSKAMQLDGRNQLARYYWGLMLMQNDRPDLSFRIWDELLQTSTPDAPWVPVIRSRIEDLAWLAGVDYKLPPQAPVATPGLTGPSAEDMETASEMTPEDRQAMIRNMVEQLNERLADEGGTPAEWARLISVLGVLGETDRATAIWGEAQTVFAGKEAALEEVRAGAKSAGLVE